MSDYSGVAPPQQSFNQSSAFAAALQRAKQVGEQKIEYKPNLAILSCRLGLINSI